EAKKAFPQPDGCVRMHKIYSGNGGEKTRESIDMRLDKCRGLEGAELLEYVLRNSRPIVTLFRGDASDDAIKLDPVGTHTMRVAAFWIQPAGIEDASSARYAPEYTAEYFQDTHGFEVKYQRKEMPAASWSVANGVTSLLDFAGCTLVVSFSENY